MITGSKTQILQGSKIIFNTLKSLGVDTVFGYPGGMILDFYNELYNQTDIKHILTRHEQSAVHAAEGYARQTGKCGVVVVTSGPGATNTVSGIVNAYLDGFPLVVITAQVMSNMIGKNAFQEANICDITKSCTKKVYQITSADNIERVFNEAFELANSGKKGPVVIDIVKEVFKQQSIYSGNALKCEIQQEPMLSDISNITNRINNSVRPVIVLGGGVKHAKAEDLVLDIVNKFKIPVVSTMMGLGTFPMDNNCYMGMIGIFGDNCANEVIKKSDLILSLGARFNDRILCKFDVVDLANKFIQIDISREEISNFVNATESLVCDVRSFLRALNQEDLKIFEKWQQEAKYFFNLNVEPQKTTNQLHSFEVIRNLEDLTKGKDVIFTTEVGQHQLWAVQNLKLYKERKIFVSGGSGTMGFGLPAAIGAAVATPNKEVVCITGDGSFQMGLHELATCHDYNLNVKIIILNNGYLGMVRQLQEKLCHSRYSETKISNPNFVTLAQSYGIPAVKVSTLGELEAAISRAMLTEGTFVIDCEVEPMEVL